jgi:hypothetical protein
MTEPDRKKGWQARAAAVRKSEERTAAKLEGRGWACFPPEFAEEARALLAEMQNAR